MTINNLSNFEELKNNYMNRFDALAATPIDELTRNDLAQILGVSYGSIKSAELTGKSKRDQLMGVKKPSTAAISAYLQGLSPEELKKLIAQ